MDRLHRRSSPRCSTTRGPTASRRPSTSRSSGRYYERFADHAVSVARRVVYLVTGERADEYVPLGSLNVELPRSGRLAPAG
jgi:phosphate transport system protein